MSKNFGDQLSMGTNFLGDHLFMGTKCLGTICPGGPIVLGTICPWGPNVWGPIVQGDQLSWGPFVHGDQMSRDCLFLGTNCGGPNVRGPNGFGTKWEAAVHVVIEWALWSGVQPAVVIIRQYLHSENDGSSSVLPGVVRSNAQFASTQWSIIWDQIIWRYW